MIRMLASVCIDAPVAAVWERLARLEDIRLWAEPVRSAVCPASASRGIGAVRTCQLVNGLTVTERWTAWDEGRSFTYEGVGLPLVKRARNTWSVSAEGPRQALLTSEAEVDLKGGPLGLLFEPVMKLLMLRMAPSSLAAFKYLVEHGRPYEGRHSRLPRVPSAC